MALGALGAESLSLGRAGGERPSDLALIDGAEFVSYAELLAGAHKAQAWLAAEGLLDAPLLAVVAEATRRSIELVLGAIDLGLPIAFVHPRLAPAERQRLLDAFPRTRSAPLIDLTLPGGGAWHGRNTATPPQPPKDLWSGNAAVGTAAAGTAAAGTAAANTSGGGPGNWYGVLFTSGSTGLPKAVELGAEQFLAALEASAVNLGWQQQDRWLLSLPVAHVGGLSIVLRCLSARRTLVLPMPGAGLDMGRITRAVEQHAVSLLSLVPTQLEQLSGWRPPPSLRAALIGGAAARSSTLIAARQCGIPVLTTYGATEACSQVATAPLGSAPRTDGAVGLPLSNTQVEIKDGRIAVRGPQVMRGYLSRECAEVTCPPPDGWLETSDAGEFTADGWLRVLGRLDDVIITGGENVHPAEVETALLGHPALRGCCVVGLPDEKFGQVLGALLVGDASRERELWEYTLGLAPHQRPRVLRWAPELPQLPNGKLDRKRALAWVLSGDPGVKR